MLHLLGPLRGVEANSAPIPEAQFQRIETVSETEHTFHDLNRLTVAQLREIAAEIDHPAVSGYTQKRKSEVLTGICTALGLEMHEHHDAKGINKTTVKTQIKEWRVKRDTALESGDHAQLKMARTKMRRLRRKIRKSLV